MDNLNTYLNECQKEVDETFTSRHKKSLYLASVFDLLEDKKRSDRLRNCGSFLEFKVSSIDSRLTFANFCKDRLCPMCNWRRSLKIFSRVSRVMDELEKQGYRFLFLTLTVRNCDNEHLKDTINMILKSYHKLLKRKMITSAICGTYRAFELTYSDNMGWHPHLHCILAVKEEYFSRSSGLYITFEKWRELWAKCCGLDYLPSILIKAVKKGKLDLSDVTDINSCSFKSAIKEVTKYISKTDGKKGYLKYNASDPERVKFLAEAIEHHDFNRFSGVFLEIAKKLKLEELEDGDLVRVNDTIRPDLSEMIVRYHWKSGAYIKHIWDYKKEVEEHGSHKLFKGA